MLEKVSICSVKAMQNGEDGVKKMRTCLPTLKTGDWRKNDETTDV